MVSAEAAARRIAGIIAVAYDETNYLLFSRMHLHTARAERTRLGSIADELALSLVRRAVVCESRFEFAFFRIMEI